METSRRVSSYDLFKFTVAVLLLILFFLLSRRITPQAPTPISSASPGAPAVVFIRARSTATPAESTIPSLTLTSISEPTVTMIPSSTERVVVELTATPLPSPTTTKPAEPTTTPLPAPTATPVATSTATSSISTPIASVCDSASSRSRLHTGDHAVIVRRLNFRSSPGIQENWLLTNLPGTKVEVIGGPQCLPHVAGAYVWWQIKLPNGQTGWSAEGSQFGSFYFMEPVK